MNGGITIPAGETFIPDNAMAMKPSPDGPYLAIPHQRVDENGIPWITLEIVDLSAL